MNQFHLDIFTPMGKYYSQDIESIKFSNDDFILKILANHAPIVSKVAISEVVIESGKNTLYYAVSGGVIEVKKDHSAILLANSIERSDEIDVERANAAKDRALKRLNDTDENIDKHKALNALKRADMRLLVALKK